MLGPSVTVELDDRELSLELLGGLGEGVDDRLGGLGRLRLVVDERPDEREAAVEVLLEVLRADLADQLERLALDPGLLRGRRSEHVGVVDGHLDLDAVLVLEEDQCRDGGAELLGVGGDGRDAERVVVAQLLGQGEEGLGLLTVGRSEHAEDLDALLVVERVELGVGRDGDVRRLGLLAHVLDDVLVGATALVLARLLDVARSAEHLHTEGQGRRMRIENQTSCPSTRQPALRPRVCL